jgi:chromosome segregation ATPase
MNTKKLDDTLRNCADADLTHHVEHIHVKHLPVLLDADLTHHVELVDDRLESEKSQLRETIARLEITVRTQGENIAVCQKALFECNNRCAVMGQARQFWKDQFEHVSSQCDRAMALIKTKNEYIEEQKSHIKELDAKCLRLTVQTMSDACVCHSDAPEQPKAESDLSNAYDDHNAHQEFIDGLARGAKYTIILLVAMAVIAFLMTMGWVGGAV